MVGDAPLAGSRLLRSAAGRACHGWVRRFRRRALRILLRCGRERLSLPPGCLFRMLLVGYFEEINSERGLEWCCADGLSLGKFLRLGDREPVRPSAPTPEDPFRHRRRRRSPHGCLLDAPPRCPYVRTSAPITCTGPGGSASPASSTSSASTSPCHSARPHDGFILEQCPPPERSVSAFSYSLPRPEKRVSHRCCWRRSSAARGACSTRRPARTSISSSPFGQ